MALLSPVDRVRVGTARVSSGSTASRWAPSTTSATSSASTAGRWPGRRARSGATSGRRFRLLAEVTFGTGALAVIGGTVGVIAFLSFFTGTEVGLQGYAALDQLGTSAFTGFLSAYFNTREIAPLVAGPGAVGDRRLRLHRPDRRHADQRGDRRPRGHGRAVAAVPGDDAHHRRLHRRHPAVRAGPAHQLLRHPDRSPPRPTASRRAPTTTTSTCSCHRRTCCWSFLKVLVFAVVIILTHCYYGYRASGGPAGVGLAVGRAVRLLDRRGQHHRPVPVPGHLGLDDDRPDRGVTGDEQQRLVIRRRVQGLAFLVVLALLLGPVRGRVQEGVHRRRHA